MRKRLLLSIMGLLVIGMCPIIAKEKYTLKESRELEKEGKAYRLPETYKVKRASGSRNLRFAGNHNATPLAKLDKPTRDYFTQNANNTYSDLKSSVPLYGYLYYDDVLDITAIYKINGENLKYIWEDPLIDEYNLLAQEGWYDDGKIMGVVMEQGNGVVTNYYSYSIDFATSQILSFEKYGLDIPVMFINARYNTEDGNIYGFAYDFDNGGKISWAMANPYDLYSTRVLNSESIYCYSLCYNESDGKFYGVNQNQEFVSLSLDGTQTVICEVPDADNYATYFAGLAWIPSLNAFYWNAQYADYASALYLVTPEGEFTLEAYYPGGTEFTYMFTTETVVNPDLPARPSITSVDFKNGALSGNITFELPTVMSDGATIPAGTSVSYTLLLDNETFRSGEGQIGESINVPVSVSTSGYHKFGVFVVYDGQKSAAANRTVWLGNDTPLAPSNVKMTESEVTWSPVGNEGVHGGYVNVGEVVYQVYVNDELYGTTSSTSLKISLPADAVISKYSATVYAVFDNMKGRGGSSNEILAGRPYQVPVFFEPTYEEYELMVIEDKNKDGITWSYWKDHNALGTLYTYNYEDFFDDYIFLPPIEITNTDKFYLFSLEAAIRAPNYPDEYLEVVYASAPSSDAIMGVLVPEFAPTAEQYDEVWTRKEALWIVTSPGTYYIGIHATSPGDQLGLLAKAFSVTESDIDETSPSAPKIEEVTAASKGQLKATVKFTYPTTLLNGDVMDSNTVLTLQALVNGELVNISQTGHPGETATCELETRQGRNEISIFVTKDGLDSPSDITSVYTGVTVPATPKNLTGEEAPDMMSISLNWSPVTTPDNRNGYVNPEEIRYAVYLQVQSAVAYHWELLQDDITNTHCTIKLQPGAPQDEYVFGVASYNAAGTNDEVISISAFLGTPYTLPMIDNFDDEQTGLSLSPWFLIDEHGKQTYNAIWYTWTLGNVDGAFAGDNRFVLYCVPQKANDKGLIGMPRFSTMDSESAEITLNIVSGPNTPAFKILGQIYGTDEMFEVGSYVPTETTVSKVVPVSYQLPVEFLNQYWVQLYIEPSFTSLDEVFILCSVEATSVASVGSVKEEGKIWTGKNSIYVSGYEGKRVIISSLEGKILVNEACKTNNEKYTLEKGVYVVKVGDQRVKAIVR